MSGEYLQHLSEWRSLIHSIRHGATVGLDTETYGHDVRESSPAWRARVDVWSVGTVTDEISPRGYRRYRGWVLPERALHHPEVRSWLAGGTVNWVLHNAGHDRHALRNYGLDLGPGVWDTLELTRLLWPGRLTYQLKTLRVDLLGKPGRDRYVDVTRPDVEIVGVVNKKGVGPTWKTRQVAVPMESIVPGHPRWTEKVDYAAEDAVDAPELLEVCMRRQRDLELRLPVMPW